MSSKIYPSEIQVKDGEEQTKKLVKAWTVWKKSSMSFVGSDGFSVYDEDGKLAFRVDNYSRKNKFLIGELLLMDPIGRPLLSLRPQIMSMYDQWKGYKGSDGDNLKKKSKSQLFSMRRRSFVHNRNDLLEVFMSGDGGGGGGATVADFTIEGCFKKRCCKIRAREGQVLASISPKKVSPSMVLDKDVFSLFMEEEVSPDLIMAFIVIMDRIW
ncbi:protein LURP-one-related 8 isoform X1 [Dendrobium catenatum]|uniref:Protein LURP-one-related 5 n=1 Tax=Dendrobium catenatum TaxID=906689 RepID=A0A2I0WSD0_9ASPA|nr:protein LURP-one-related 8 isoform X1 [Dendrobium catenatum]PKU78582.1 Protein LURP-one-related 5 [Dendrobium catenatum]